MTTEEARTVIDAGRSALHHLASESFLRFLDHVSIMEPPPGRGRIKFEKWPYLMEVADLFVSERLIIILKARQLGFSWIVAAYAVWMALFHEGAVVLMLSRGETESHALLGKARFILVNLPKGWLPKMGTDSRSELSFPTLSSKIMALPATEDAGRSETASVVIQDEGDFHFFLETNYLALKPTIDAGGQMIMGSTSNKKKMISLFKELYRDSPSNGWARKFLGWKLRPGRDERWYNETKASIPTVALEGLTPEAYMEQEYPGTDLESLAPARAASAFNPDSLLEMQEYVKEPFRSEDGMNFYQRWRMGTRYACGTDVSKGTGYDYGASVVLDLQSGYVVADIMSNTMTAEELVYNTKAMLAHYRDPIWAIEDNGLGDTAIKAVEREGYPHLFKRRTGRKARVVGWHTDSRSRMLLWGELVEAVNAHQIIVPNKDGLAQFTTLWRNSEGRVDALQGTHDDYPMAVGIALQAGHQAHGSAGKVVTLGPEW